MEKYFQGRENIIQVPPYGFKLVDNYKDFQEIILPDGFELKEIDHNLLSKISGNVVPAFSWSDSSEFLAKGKGFCIVKNNEVAAVAFSAAISHNQIDIGIETNEKYCRQGLAAIVARKMIQYAISVKKEPVWDCNVQNVGSKCTAEKVGFRIEKTYSYFKER